MAKKIDSIVRVFLTISFSMILPEGII